MSIFNVIYEYINWISSIESLISALWIFYWDSILFWISRTLMHILAKDFQLFAKWYTYTFCTRRVKYEVDMFW